MAAMMAQELEAKQGFTYQVEDNVAVLTFDQPGESVNTLSPARARCSRRCSPERRRTPR